MNLFKDMKAKAYFFAMRLDLEWHSDRPLCIIQNLRNIIMYC